MKQIYFTFALIILTLGWTNKDACFVIEKINEQTFAITEPTSNQRNSSFLKIGEKEAILFNAGKGDLVFKGLSLVDNCNTYLNSLNSIMEISKPTCRVFGSSDTFSYSQYDSLSAINIINSPQDSVTIGYNEAVSLLRRSKSDLALEILFRLKETVGLNHTLSDKITVSIAEGYRQRQEYKKGLDLLNELLNKPDITLMDQANAFNRIAALYNEGPPFPSKYDSVIKYSYQCIEIAEKKGFTAELAASQNELGFVYGTTSTYKNYSKALELLNAALENFRSLELHQNAVNVSINLSQIYLEINDFEKAHQVIDTAIASCSEEDNKNLFYRAYYFKASIYEKQGNYEKAYEYLSKSLHLNHSFFRDRLNTEIFDMAAKYETEKKERENLELLKNNEIQALKLSYKNNAITFLSIGLSVAGMLLLVIFSLLQRKKIAYKNLVKKNIELARWDEIHSEAEYIFGVEETGIIERQSANDRDKEEEIIENFRKYFAQEKPFLNSHISIEDVSARIGTNRTYLSKAINEVYRKSFNTIVNEFRIRAARQIITDTKHDHLSLEAIADMVGYSSRTTFIRNFKKFTGLTPSYFRESIKKNLR